MAAREGFKLKKQGKPVLLCLTKKTQHLNKHHTEFVCFSVAYSMSKNKRTDFPCFFDMQCTVDPLPRGITVEGRLSEV